MPRCRRWGLACGYADILGVQIESLRYDSFMSPVQRAWGQDMAKKLEKAGQSWRSPTIPGEEQVAVFLSEAERTAPGKMIVLVLKTIKITEGSRASLEAIETKLAAIARAGPPEAG